MGLGDERADGGAIAASVSWMPVMYTFELVALDDDWATFGHPTGGHCRLSADDWVNQMRPVRVEVKLPWGGPT